MVTSPNQGCMLMVSGDIISSLCRVRQLPFSEHRWKTAAATAVSSHVTAALRHHWGDTLPQINKRWCHRPSQCFTVDIVMCQFTRTSLDIVQDIAFIATVLDSVVGVNTTDVTFMWCCLRDMAKLTTDWRHTGNMGSQGSSEAQKYTCNLCFRKAFQPP